MHRLQVEKELDAMAENVDLDQQRVRSLKIDWLFVNLNHNSFLKLNRTDHTFDSMKTHQKKDVYISRVGQCLICLMSADLNTNASK